MSLQFDDMEYDDESFIGEAVKQALSVRVGDCVVYNKPAKTFQRMDDDIEFENDSDYIPIGTAIQQNDDLSFTVLMKCFLSNQPLILPGLYWQASKKQLAPIYVKQQFQRHADAFIQRCPSISKIKRMKLRMPTVDDMTAVISNVWRFEYAFNRIRVNDEGEFVKKLLGEYVYVNFRGLTVLWKYNAEELDNPDIFDVSHAPGMMPVVFTARF